MPNDKYTLPTVAMLPEVAVQQKTAAELEPPQAGKFLCPSCRHFWFRIQRFLSANISPDREQTIRFMLCMADPEHMELREEKIYECNLYQRRPLRWRGGPWKRGRTTLTEEFRQRHTDFEKDSLR